MLDGLSLYCLILHDFLKLLGNVISEPWFICIIVYVSHEVGLATCFVSLSNIDEV